MTELPKASVESIGDALRFGRRALANSGSETPRLDAEVLLRHVLGLDRTALFVRLLEPMGPDASATYHRLLGQRANGVPVAYLTGEREFMGLPFAVNPAVLVPRPETEILVEWALRWLALRKNATVVDVGTGSGAIALSLAALAKPGEIGHVIGVDVSECALALAAHNRARFGLQDRVVLVQGSLLGPVAGPIDLVLANLPYLSPEQIAENPHLDAEPLLALDGGASGLDLIRQLLLHVPSLLSPAGAIGLEIDPSQSESVCRHARVAFPGANIVVLPDLAGRDRHVTVQTAVADATD